MEPISKIDVTTNQLFFRGFNVAELSKTLDYESVLYLLINGKPPTESEHREFTQKLIDLRRHYQDNISSLVDLAFGFAKIGEDNQLSKLETLLIFVSLAPLVVAHEFGRHYNQQIERPNEELGYAANFLWMTKCIPPTEMDLHDFETSLILHMDDPVNPSLSALSKAIRDGNSVTDALLAALATHVEPLHHGAGTEAMMMFREMRNLENPRAYLSNRVDSGLKIFGLGHRIYQKKDPRAVVLEGILERRILQTSEEWLLQVIVQVTREGYSILKERKGIEAYPNVDLYNAAVYSTFGFPPEMNTELFAISRVAGWIAHIVEFSAF